MNPSEEIKSKLDIVEVLGEYISLRPAGGNLRALCPFHGEKTPSFMVSPEKQIWHCFGCGRGGDIFGFVMEMEGLTFGEALKMLAPRAGVTLKFENIQESSKRNKLLDIMSTAQEYYHRQMLGNDNIKEYLKKRGLDEATVRQFKIGYSPESWDDIIKHLREKKYTLEEIFLSGLAIKKDNRNEYYNRFRDRVMFPIWDVAGQVVAFTARINPNNNSPEAEKTGKYINSPETTLYSKGRILFALNFAKQEIKQKNLCIVVEGQMDAISSHQYGFKNTVASSGTALTGEQIKLIKRYTNNIALAFDADSAGQIAADRGIKEAMVAEMDIKIITIPSGKDPDETLKNNPADWQKAIDSAVPMMEYYFHKIIKENDLSEVSGKRIVAKKALEMISHFENKIEADHWLKKLSEKIDINEMELREEMKKLKGKEKEIRNTALEASQKMTETASREDRMSDLLLSFLVRFPDFVEYVVSNFESEMLSGPSNSPFYNHLIMYYNTNRNLEYSGFRDYLTKIDQKLGERLDLLTLFSDQDFPDITPAEVKNEIIKIILHLKKSGIKRQLAETEKKIARAEKEGHESEITALMTDMKDLSDKLKEFDI
jgi:DNA primase